MQGIQFFLIFTIKLILKFRKVKIWPKVLQKSRIEPSPHVICRMLKALLLEVIT